MAQTAPQDVPEWCAFATERAALADLHLAGAVAAVAAAGLPADEVAGAIEAAALRAWLDTTIERDERLHRYQAAERDALVAQYRDLDRRIVDQANTLVAATCGDRRPRSLTGRRRRSSPGRRTRRAGTSRSGSCWTRSGPWSPNSSPAS